jgi:hypothetical protein
MNRGGLSLEEKLLLCEREEWEKKTPHTCHIYEERKLS